MAAGSGAVYNTYKGAILWVNRNGTFQDVQGMEGITISRPEAESQTIPTTTVTLQETSIPQPPQIEFNITTYVETDPVWKYLKSQFISHDDVEVAITTRERQIRGLSKATDQIAVAIGGIVTFSGTSSAAAKQTLGAKQYYRGICLKSGTRYFIVQTWPVTNGSLDDSTDKVMVFDAATGLAPTSALTAASYSVVMMPMLIGPFSATISTVGNISGSTSSCLLYTSPSPRD